jgi:hypothetical protein
VPKRFPHKSKLWAADAPLTRLPTLPYSYCVPRYPGVSNNDTTPGWNSSYTYVLALLNQQVGRAMKHHQYPCVMFSTCALAEGTSCSRL